VYTQIQHNKQIISISDIKWNASNLNSEDSIEVSKQTNLCKLLQNNSRNQQQFNSNVPFLIEQEMT